MLKLWGRATSSNVQKAMWAIGELGLAYERVDVGGAYGGLDTPDFGALNPNRKIPAIEDDGGVVGWESNAVVRYLASRYGAGTLYPEDWAARMAADQWMDWMQTTLYPDFGQVFWGLVRTPSAKRDGAAIDRALARAHQHYTALDAHLAGRPFVAGERLTMGDIPIGSTLYRYYDMAIPRPDLPRLRDYYDRLVDRPAYREHVMVSYDSLRATD